LGTSEKRLWQCTERKRETKIGKKVKNILKEKFTKKNIFYFKGARKGKKQHLMKLHCLKERKVMIGPD